MAQNTQGAFAPTDTFSNFSCNHDDRAMFRVATGLPIGDVLDSVSCYLAAALDTAELAADNSGQEAGFAVVYLIEMAKAAIDSVNRAFVGVGANGCDDGRLGNVFYRLCTLHENGVLIVNPSVDKLLQDDAGSFLEWAKQQAKGGAQ